MTRPRRSVAVLCIAVVALAAFLPSGSAVDYVLFEPSWVLLPDLTPTLISDADAPADEQPIALLALHPTRAPPALLG